MAVVPKQVEEYARSMEQLLPRGNLWRSLDVDSVLYKTLLGAAEEMRRIGTRSAELIEEADPQTTSAALSDHERELALVSTGTDEERRARIVAKTIQAQRCRPIDIQNALAPYLALSATDVEVIEVTSAQAASTGDETRIYLFHVFRDPANPGTPDLEAAQSVLDSICHSHILGRVFETKSMICDDPDSLCDRDLIGV